MLVTISDLNQAQKDYNFSQEVYDILQEFLNTTYDVPRDISDEDYDTLCNNALSVVWKKSNSLDEEDCILIEDLLGY
jgi:hypothetical protein